MKARAFTSLGEFSPVSRLMFTMASRWSTKLPGLRLRKTVLALAGTAIVCLLGAAAPAQALVMEISAVGFIQHCSSCNADVETNGVLLPQNSGFHLYAPVVFPVGGNVCSFSIVYQDSNQAENLTAQLKQKQFTIGQSALNTPAFVMATVHSAGGANVVGKMGTFTVQHPTIDALNSFYYVEVQGNINENFLGIQIGIRPSCT